MDGLRINFGGMKELWWQMLLSLSWRETTWTWLGIRWGDRRWARCCGVLLEEAEGFGSNQTRRKITSRKKSSPDNLALLYFRYIFIINTVLSAKPKQIIFFKRIMWFIDHTVAVIQLSRIKVLGPWSDLPIVYPPLCFHQKLRLAISSNKRNKTQLVQKGNL